MNKNDNRAQRKHKQNDRRFSLQRRMPNFHLY